MRIRIIWLDLELQYLQDNLNNAYKIFILIVDVVVELQFDVETERLINFFKDLL